MKKICFICVLALATGKGFCQNSVTIQQAPSKSGLSYETLTKFFQSNVSTENGGGYTFKATLFSTFNLLKNGRLDLSDYYNSPNGIFARNFEYTLGINKGKDGGFNLFNGGVKYAIINNRDKSNHNFFNDFATKEQTIGQINAQADAAYLNEILAMNDTAKANTARKMWTAAKLKYIISHDLSDLPKRVLELRDNLTEQQLGLSQTDYYKDIQNKYDIIAKKADLRGLLTLNINPEYKWNTKQVDSINLSLKYLVGLGKNYKRPWYFDLQLSKIFLQDTVTKKGLSRNVSKALVGINKVLSNDSKDNPIFELEFAFEDSYINKGFYKEEERNIIKADAVFRLHITKELLLPVTLKYDLKNPNLFGIISIQWNLENTSSSK